MVRIFRSGFSLPIFSKIRAGQRFTFQIGPVTDSGPDFIFRKSGPISGPYREITFWGRRFQITDEKVPSLNRREFVFE